MNLRTKLIRLAHQRPELRAELLPLLVQAKTAAADPKMLGKANQELLKGGKQVLTAIGKMAGIKKKCDALDRKGGAQADLVKLAGEYNGWAAAVRKAVTGFIGGFDLVAKEAPADRYLDLARKERDLAAKVLQNKQVVDVTKPAGIPLDMVAVQRDMDTLYTFLEGYGVVLSRMTGNRALDANPFKSKFAAAAKSDRAVVAEAADLIKKLRALRG